MTLTAPEHLRGPMHKHTAAERSDWALDAGRAGHSAGEVAEALGISQPSAWRIMRMAGWRWHEQTRINRHPPRSDPRGGRAMMRTAQNTDPAFLEYFARVMEAEASKRAHQPEFAAWLLGSASRARAEAMPAQLELFA